MLIKTIRGQAIMNINVSPVMHRNIKKSKNEKI